MKDQKMFFVQKTGPETFETESLWCSKSGSNFVIDNIPFIAKNVSWGDTVKGEYDNDDKVYYFDGLVEVSGNSTIRIYFEDEGIIQKVRDDLDKFNCESEAFLARKMIAVNIPKEVDYGPVKEYLENGEQRDFWTYEESCLAHKY